MLIANIILIILSIFFIIIGWEFGLTIWGFTLPIYGMMFFLALYFNNIMAKTVNLIPSLVGTANAIIFLAYYVRLNKFWNSEHATSCQKCRLNSVGTLPMRCT